MIQKSPEPAAFSRLEEFASLLRCLPEASKLAEREAQERNNQLTKPEGSLGRLEALAIWYHSWRRPDDPFHLTSQILIFAGNHGVVEHGVSAYPSTVTGQMVSNFGAGGAAINQLAKVANAQLDVVPLELDRPTADFSVGPAMNEEEYISALNAGWNAVADKAELLLIGEMGIGNTTSAAAICLALFGGQATDWVGRGTGVKDEALARKQEIVQQSLHANRPLDEKSGLEILRRFGGRELAAMAGAIIKARILRIPVVLDGFVCCAAAACLQKPIISALDHTVAGHLSAELAHATLLQKMGKSPLLDLSMRLGEGSGAAVAAQIVKCALVCHCGMATFDDAGIAKN